MEKNIRVSVMVTFYNQKQYIEECLTSILKQDIGAPFEIICGDDGSTDGTYEILLEWHRRYPEKITVYRMPRKHDEKYEPIERVSHNRINMLKHAKGKYIAFLDGDDYYLDDSKLSKQVEILEKNESISACGHPVKMIWDNKEQSDVVIGRISNEKIKIKRDIYWAFIWLHADSFLYRNIFFENPELIDKIDTHFFDDNLITCYFLLYGDVMCLPDCMVAYRQFVGSSWNSRSELEKAYVNMRVYGASKHVLKNKNIICFVRCIEAWETLYKYRKSDIKIDDGMSDILKIPFVQKTVNYKNYSLIDKFLYQVIYFIPIHSKIIIKILNKLKRVSYRVCR